MNKNLNIGGIQVSEDSPTFIIAELSANHNNDFDLAIESIKAIKESGADAIKVQTFTPDSMTLKHDSEMFMTRKDSNWAGRSLYSLYEEGSLPYEWHVKMKEVAEDLGLVFFSAPFDKEGVDFLEGLDVPAFKIASMEITDIPLIKHVASKGRPMIISTGIAEIADIELAVKTCKEQGNDQVILLKCTSSYPTPYKDAHLANISWISENYDCLSGLSDHTLDIYAPICAVSLGAKVIEKHFILDKSIGSLDADFSLDKSEFKQMVDAIRATEKLIGQKEYFVTEKMKKAYISSRSIFVINDIAKGEVISEDNIKVIRPGYGLHPKFFEGALGKKALVEIERGTPLSKDHFN